MLKPLKDKVILTVEKEEKTKSGIVLNEPLEKDCIIATVYSISNEEEKLKVKDKVVISKFSGSKIEYENEEYLIIDIDSILAKVEEE